jgi:indolepyruvate ferredoxin oxidoreductase alpha subunit
MELGVVFLYAIMQPSPLRGPIFKPTPKEDFMQPSTSSATSTQPNPTRPAPQLLLGNDAVARGAYEAGVRVVSSYPGTPSTEITETLAKLGVYAEWAPNEKVALEVALGASVAGARAFSGMKHVGLNVAADPLFTASYTGVGGGLVICVADDPGMHSSQNEQDSRHYARAAKVPMLEPADSEECRLFIKQAYELSEAYDTPVLLRLSTRVSHSQSPVAVEAPEASQAPEAPPLQVYKKNPGKYVMMPAMARGRHKFVEERTQRLAALAEASPLNTVSGQGRVGVITAGIGYQVAREALGDAVRYLKLGMVWPLPEQLLRAFVRQVDVCYVIEELDPFLEDQCKALRLPVRGKEFFSPLGEYTARQVREVILGQAAPGPALRPPALPGRPPVLCPGCPHKAAFFAVKRLGLTVTGDIGCYTLGALPPLETLDTCVCMGAGVGMAHGMEKAGGPKALAVLGDSTFLHSGVTGLMNIAYNQGTATVLILDNSITGMTGHQQNPATGQTLMGRPTPPVDLKKLCEALGIRRVTVADPFQLEAFTELLRRETEAEEPSVIIAQKPCALLPSFTPGVCRKITASCKNCGLCLRVGCPAISRQASGAAIDGHVCVGCGFCAQVCKFGAIVEGGEDNG